MTTIRPEGLAARRRGSNAHCQDLEHSSEFMLLEKVVKKLAASV